MLEIMPLTPSKSGSGKDVVSYMEEYHRETGRVTVQGEFFGSGVKDFGLTPEYSSASTCFLYEGKDPQTGEDLIGKGRRKDRVMAWDMTFSAPKSFSSLFAVADEETKKELARIFNESVKESLSYAEEQSFFETREGKGGKAGRKKAKPIFVIYDHNSSREGDPHKHTHVALINLVKDGTRVKALDSKKFFEGAKAMSMIHSAILQDKLNELGKKTQYEKNGIFHIEEIPLSLEKEWSKRKGQIGEGTIKERQISQRATRKDKTYESDDFERWQKEAEKHADSPKIQIEDKKEFSKEDVLIGLTEFDSVISGDRILESVAEEVSRSGGGLKEIKERYKEILDSDELIKVGENRFTTKHQYESEKNLIQSLEKMSKSKTNSLKIKDYPAGYETLNADQKKAIAHMIEGPDFAVVEGKAGVGKTYTMKIANEIWEAEGKRVIGLSPTGKAAVGLVEANINADTVDAFLINISPGLDGKVKERIGKNDIIIIDEAGMLGTKNWALLQKKIDESGAKLIVAGDSKQFSSVTAGGVFAYASKTFGAVVVSKVVRQKSEADREFVQDISNYQFKKSLKNAAEEGRLKTSDQPIQNLVEDHIRLRKEGHTPVVLADLNKDVDTINRRIRKELKVAGLLQGEDSSFREVKFCTGDRVIFYKGNDKKAGVANGDCGTVQQAEDGRMVITLDRKDRKGKNITIIADENLKTEIKHGYAITNYKSQGISVDSVQSFLDPAKTKAAGAYVALSRFKESLSIYSTGTAEELAKALEMEKSIAGKKTAYEIIEVGKNSVPEVRTRLNSKTETPDRSRTFRDKILKRGQLEELIAVKTDQDRKEKKIEEREISGGKNRSRNIGGPSL